MSEEADMGVTWNYSQIDVLPLPVMILDVEVKSCWNTFLLRVLTLHSPSVVCVFVCVLYLQTKMEECGEMSPALPLSHGPTPSQTALQHPQLMLTGSQLAGVRQPCSVRPSCFALLCLTSLIWRCVYWCFASPECRPALPKKRKIWLSLSFTCQRPAFCCLGSKLNLGVMRDL